MVVIAAGGRYYLDNRSKLLQTRRKRAFHARRFPSKAQGLPPNGDERLQVQSHTGCEPSPEGLFADQPQRQSAYCGYFSPSA
jgi:hypothetical protein